MHKKRANLKWIIALALLLCAAVAVYGQIKISELPAASSANSGDELPANQSGTTKKLTVGQIVALATGTDDQTAAEVPFTPAGGVAATDTQAAIEEVDSEAEKVANKDQNGGYIGRDGSGNAEIPGTFTAGAIVVTGDETNTMPHITAPGAHGTAGNSNFYLDESDSRPYWHANGGSAITPLMAAQEEVNSGDLAAANKTETLSWGIADPGTADSDNLQKLFSHAVTITRIDCSCDSGTADIEFEERVLTTPNTAGTEVIGTDLVCDSNNEQETSFANAAIAANALLSLKITDVSGCTQLRTHVRYTID